MSDAKTLQVYAQKADDYAKMIAPIAKEDSQLSAFIDALPAGGAVLDLGCGPGHFAARMAASGLKVVAFDPVPEMIEKANAFEGVDARVAGFDDLSGTSLFDGIWANFSLLHAPRSKMPTYLSRIHQALRSGGVFHIGVKTGSDEVRDSIGRLYTYYSVPELRGLLTTAGFDIEHETTGADAGLSGEVAPWVCLRARA